MFCAGFNQILYLTFDFSCFRKAYACFLSDMCRYQYTQYIPLNYICPYCCLASFMSSESRFSHCLSFMSSESWFSPCVSFMSSESRFSPFLSFMSSKSWFSPCVSFMTS